MNIGATARTSSNSVDRAELAKRAEELGFESFWLPDHPILPVPTTAQYGGMAYGSVPASMEDIGGMFIAPDVTAANDTIKPSSSISLVTA